MRRAKPALERGGSLDGSLPGPPPRDSEGAPPPLPNLPKISSHRSRRSNASITSASPPRRASPARKAAGGGALRTSQSRSTVRFDRVPLERQPCLRKRVVGSRSGPSRLWRTHRECSSRALRNAPDCWSSPRVLTWDERSRARAARARHAVAGRAGHLRVPRGRAHPVHVSGSAPEGGQNRRGRSLADGRQVAANRREQGRRQRPERRIENWT